MFRWIDHPPSASSRAHPQPCPWYSRLAREIALVEAMEDRAGLDVLEDRLRHRLAAAAPLDWAADQISLAGVALARRRLGGPEPRRLNLILNEAVLTAREMGVPALAERAGLLLLQSGL